MKKLFLKILKLNIQKKYASAEEEAMRFINFKESLKRMHVARLNERATATYGINKFSDLSHQEFNQRFKGFKSAPVQTLAISCLTQGIELDESQLDMTNVPDNWDWRTQGKVTPVKNQQDCGSCWTFSTTGNIESAWAIKHNLKVPVSLSEQEIVDCSHGCDNQPPYGKVCNQGCDGGWPWIAMHDVMTTLGGLESESSYPYTAVTDQCTENKAKIRVKISNYTCLSNPNNPNGASEEVMKAFIAQKGPLSIGVDACWLQDYYGGITWPYWCDSTVLDHAVLIVGYGVETGWYDESVPYWIVKNSWGTDWGEAGYFRTLRGTNTCGLAYAVSSAII